jgi:flagellar basal-body rod protein FlgC
MLSTLDISASALTAQRTRLNAISSNIANISTTHNEAGEPAPYQPRYVVFQADAEKSTPHGGVGVKVSSVEVDQADPLYKFEPNNPLAIQEGKWKGYVAYPNINLTSEFVDALEATRAYEANVGVIETTKSLGAQTLRILG